jgi:hypothetical protein
VEESILWVTNGTGDGAAEITRAQWIDFFSMLFLRDNTTEGVVPQYLNTLSVSSTGDNNIRISSGGAVVRGFLYRNTSNVDKTVNSPAADTGFRVVLRATWATQTVRAEVSLNTTGITTPPAVTQVDSTTWEISLATGIISSAGVISSLTSIDAKEFLHFATQVSSTMIDFSAVTEIRIADDAVTNDKIADDAVNTAQIVDDAVTQAKLADDSVGSAQIIADAVGTPEIAAGAVGTSELANDSVTDAKAGDRIIQLPERVGNSATDWQDSGITTIAPGAIRMHVGARNCTISAGNAAGTLTNLTFPTAYSDKPWMGMTLISTSTQVVVGQLENITATDFDVRVTRKDETDTGSEWVVLVLWQSIGGA